VAPFAFQPFDAPAHVNGICDLALAPYLLALFLEAGRDGMIVHSRDGVDELATATALTGANNVAIKIAGDHVWFAQCGAPDVGRASRPIAELPPERDLADEAREFAGLLGGHQSAYRDMVVLNVAAMLATRPAYRDAGVMASVAGAIPVVEDLLDSGRA